MATALPLGLVIDKSSAYLIYQRDKLFAAWGVDGGQARKISTIKEAGGVTLFDDLPPAVLLLEDAEGLKKLVEVLEKAPEAQVEEWVGSGLVILTSVPRTQTKKLEALVSKLGGTVVVTTSKDTATPSEKLVRDLKLPRGTERFLLAYVGEDYELLLPLVRSIEELPEAARKRITEEDIYIRMPQPEGAVKPWELEKPLLAEDVEAAVRMFRRIQEHSSYLVPLAILRNKFLQAYKTAVILEENPRASHESIARLVELKNSYQLKYIIKDYVHRYGATKLGEVVAAINEVEPKVKGFSAAPSGATMEALLIKIMLILKRGRG